MLVRDGITKIAGPAYNQSFSTNTHELQTVQFGIDHNAILWCNQLVTTVVQGIHSWINLPAERSDVLFWAEQLKSAAGAAEARGEESTILNADGGKGLTGAKKR